MLVLEWWRVALGVGLGMVTSTIGLWIARERSRPVLVASAMGVGIGTALWNSMLNIRHALTIDGDIAFRLFPISWQDTGTGIFCFAMIAMLLLATVHKNEPGHRTLKIASISAGIAFLFDVYTW
jgi:hypothetical protein